MSIKKYFKETEDDGQLFEEMSGAEIAKEMGITRQAVSNTLKRALEKMYKGMKKDGNTSPFETAANIAVGLSIGDSGEDWKKFFNLFPPAIRKEIEEDGKKLMVGRLKDK